MRRSSVLQIVFITGMSGSGKSVALHALEDIGFYCVDNLPPELILAFIDLQLRALDESPAVSRLAIAVDVRSAKSLPLMPAIFSGLRRRKITFHLVFLDASDETLNHRYSETRRLHPLSNPQLTHASNDQRLALHEAIQLERQLLEGVREHAHTIDTSLIRATQLQRIVKDLVNTRSATHHSSTLTVVFESFAFKRGVPLDADYVFDVRMLPNPHYEPSLKALTGRDAPVMDYLSQHAQVQEMLNHIAQFVRYWLPLLQNDHRSYVTVAIGCTGGQHRSVYLVEQLTQRFQPDWSTLTRHRELL